MKKAVLFLSTCLMVPPAIGQGRESVLADTLYSVQAVIEAPLAVPALKLPRYQLNACLLPTLTQLLDADKRCGDTVGYYFAMKKTNGQDLITVSPILLSRVRPGNFFGYFLSGSRIFLCHGTQDAYLSRAVTTDSLTLRPYLAKGSIYDDFFLGGDTDGAVQQILVVRNL